MNSSAQKIYNCISKEPTKASSIAKQVGFSRQTVHKYLRDLVAQGLIGKSGAASHATYHTLSKQKRQSQITESFNFFKTKLLPTYKEKFSQKFVSNLNLTKSELYFDFLLSSSVLYSSKIEGNTLDLNSYLNSKNISKKDKPKEAQEIDDLASVYRDIERLVLSEQNLLQLHKVFSRTFLSKTRQGVYRQEPVGVFSSSGIVYLAVESDLVVSEMNKLFKVVEKLIDKQLDTTEVLFWAAWLHLMFVLIHPFSDGNGRAARLLEKWFLTQFLGIEAIYLPTEEWYFTHRDEYYESLKLGVNYWEVDFDKACYFLDMLPRSLQ